MPDFPSNSKEMFENDSSDEEEAAPDPKYSSKKIEKQTNNGSSSDDEEEDDNNNIQQKQSNNNNNNNEEEAEEEDDAPETSSSQNKNVQLQNNDDNDDGWNVVTITHRWVGSLLELSKNPEKAFSQIEENSKMIFQAKESEDSINSKNSDSNANQQKKSHNSHILKEINLKKLRSSFPVTLKLKIDGIDAKDQNHFTSFGGGEAGILTILPREEVLKQNKKLVEGNKLSSESRFLKQFKGWNSNNLNNGLSEVKGTQWTLVKKLHPVLEVSKTVEKKLGKKMIGKAIKGWYQAPTEHVNVCLDIIRENLDKNLQIKDLNKLRFQISRGFINSNSTSHADSSAWIDKTEFEGISDESVKKAMDEKHKLYVELEFKFKNV